MLMEIMQDHDLGVSLLKTIRGDNRAASAAGIDNAGAVASAGGCCQWLALTPFSAALALSIMHAQRFEVQVVETLSKLASDGARHASRLDASPWLSDGLLGRVTIDLHESHVPNVLRAVVEASLGWDRLTPSVVALGFALIDRAPAVPTAGGAGGTDKDGLGGPWWGAALGKQLLLDTYLANHSSRETAVTKSLTRIVTRAPGASLLLELLADLARACPLDLLAHQVRPIN